MCILLTRLQYLYLFSLSSEIKFTMSCVSIKYVILSILFKLLTRKTQIFIKRQNVTITLELKKPSSEERRETLLSWNIYKKGDTLCFTLVGKQICLLTWRATLTLASRVVCSSHILEKTLWGMWQTMEDCLPTNWPHTADPGSVPMRTPLYQPWWLLGPLEARTKLIQLVSFSSQHIS